MVSTRKLELRSNQLTFELSKRRSLQKWHKWHKWQWFVLNRISIKWTQGHKWYLNSQNSLATCRSRFVDFVGLAWCFASRFALCYRDRSWSHETFLLVWEIIDLLGSGVQVVVHRLVPGFRGAKEKRRNDVLMFFYLIHSNSTLSFVFCLMDMWLTGQGAVYSLRWWVVCRWNSPCHMAWVLWLSMLLQLRASYANGAQSWHTLFICFHHVPSNAAMHLLKHIMSRQRTELK